MRWSIVRLIWLRELRDQLRDRRTVFMIAVLPLLLYPVAGFGVLQLASGFVNQPSTVGIQGAENLPRPWPAPVAAAVAPFAAVPAPPGAPLGAVERTAAVLALTRFQPYPALIVEPGGAPSFSPPYLERGGKTGALTLRLLGGTVPDARGPDLFLQQVDRGPLDDREHKDRVDLLVVVPPDFAARLADGEPPVLYVLSRPKDDNSRLVNVRVHGILARWQEDLKRTRLMQHGLPARFGDPFLVHDPERARPAGAREEEGLFSLLVRVFPFILVMWSLAGALYPAVDLCAGEKERGTMETLLITPAARDEIVWGKFLTIWVFSAGTALLNLLSMGLTTWKFASAAPGTGFGPLALFWAVLLLLPLSAFFSAVCLAVGAYARSTKEGQYYLMPLFLVTMPLVFLTLAPGVELSPFYSMVPVTGVALLLQKLMAGEGSGELYLYFVPVLVPMMVYSWLALRWAIAQFQREEVLFREAERLDLGLWFGRLLRDKEALPSAGQAFFCFGLVLALRWIAFNVGTNLPLLVRTGTSQIAFVAAPPLFMALMLTTRPRLGLGLRRPPAWGLAAGALLAVAIVLPFFELTLLVLRQFPAFQALLRERHPLTNELLGLSSNDYPSLGVRLRYFLGLALVPALCEELAFRGFILTGLRRRFRPWAAVLLSSFLFALYQMNVFQFAAHFLAGIVLALLVVRSNSLFPAIVFHLVFNTLVIAPGILLPELFEGTAAAVSPVLRALAAISGAVLAVGGLFLVRRLGGPVSEPEKAG